MHPYIRFTAEEIEELETAVAAIPVVGSRYDALHVHQELNFFGGDALRGNTRTHPEHDG